MWIISIYVSCISLKQLLGFTVLFLQCPGEQRAGWSYFLVRVSRRGKAVTGGLGINSRPCITHELYLVGATGFSFPQGRPVFSLAKVGGKSEGRDGLALGGGPQAFLELALLCTPCSQPLGSWGQDFPPRVDLGQRLMSCSIHPGLLPQWLFLKCESPETINYVTTLNSSVAFCHLYFCVLIKITDHF